MIAVISSMVLTALLLLLSASESQAQMKCDPATATLQTCTVTVFVTTDQPPKLLTLQRKDGAGPMTTIATAAPAAAIVNVFTDTGDVNHCFLVFADKRGSNIACWTTPAIAIIPPSIPMVPPLANITIPGVQPPTPPPSVWTLGKPSTNKLDPPGTREVLRNGVSAGGALAFNITRCGNEIYVLGRLRTYWWFTKGTWINTKSSAVPCS